MAKVEQEIKAAPKTKRKYRPVKPSTIDPEWIRKHNAFIRKCGNGTH